MSKGKSKHMRCSICGDEAEQLILYEGFLFCGRDCIRIFDQAEPERKMIVHFYSDDNVHVSEQAVDLTFAMFDGVVPPTPQAGETWEISMRKVSEG